MNPPKRLRKTENEGESPAKGDEEEEGKEERRTVDVVGDGLTLLHNHLLT